MTTNTNPNGTLVHRLLSVNPYPVVSDLRLEFDRTCHFTIDGAEWCFDDRWYVGDETIAHHLPTAEHITADMLHSEIGRVRMVMDSVVSLEQIKADCVGTGLPTEQTFVSIDRYRELEAQLKTVTEECDKYKASYDYAQNLLNQVWDLTGWLEKTNEPCGIEYLRHLKFKADREELLTVEVAKLQEGIKNYEAQLKGYAANKLLQMLARITTILRDAEIATVYDYESEQLIETDEQVRIICEQLKQNTVDRRNDGAKMHKLADEIRQAHLTLNDLNASRCMGTIDLSLSARIRSVFNTKV